MPPAARKDRRAAWAMAGGGHVDLEGRQVEEVGQQRVVDDAGAAGPHGVRFG
jgi:hypothetical protein